MLKNTSQNKIKKKKQLNRYIKYSSIGTQMAAIIFLGAFLGDYIDSKNHRESSFYTISLSLFSVLFSFYYVIREIIKNNEKE